MSNTFSKLAAIAITTLMLTAAWFLLGEPYLDLWQDRIAKVERLQRKHNALSQLIKDKDHYQQQYQAVSDSSGLQQVFLEEKTGALAEAKLQRIIKQIVSNSGAQLIQATIVNTGSKSTSKNNNSGEIRDNKMVRIKVLMQGSIKSVYTALQELENNRPLIIVSNLEITHTKPRYQVAGATSNSIYRTRYDATAFVL